MFNQRLLASVALTGLLFTQVACSSGSTPGTVNPSNNPPATNQPSQPAATRPVMVDLQVLTKGAANNQPVQPDQIEYVTIGGVKVERSQLVMVEAKTGFATKFLNFEDLIKNQLVNVLFGQNGVLTFIIPESMKAQGNLSIQLKLKSFSEPYTLVVPVDANRGVAIVDGSKVTGGFTQVTHNESNATATANLRNNQGVDTNGNPATGPLPVGFAELMANAAAYYDLSKFDLKAFANYFELLEGDLKITLPNNQQLSFSVDEVKNALNNPPKPAPAPATDNQRIEQQAEQNTQPLSPISGFLGKWKTVLPFVNITVRMTIEDAGNNMVRATTTYNNATYSGTASYTQNGADNYSFNAEGQGNLDIQITQQSSNVITFKLNSQQGIPQLAQFVGSSAVLHRDLD